jgi:hypothetical protein
MFTLAEDMWVEQGRCGKMNTCEGGASKEMAYILPDNEHDKM